MNLNKILFYIFIPYFCILTKNLYPMTRLPHMEVDCRLKTHKLPYNPEEMNLDQFMATEKGKHFNKEHLRSSDMIVKTDISDELNNIVYETSPLEIKHLIEDYLPGEIEEDSEYVCKNIFLHGPKSSGKTTTLKMITKRINRPTLFINACWVATTYSKTDIVNLKETILPFIEKGIPCIVAIDNFEFLNRRQRDWLYKVIMKSNDNVCFLFTTKNIEKVDERFTDHDICQKIEIPLPGHEERKKILTFFIEEMKENCENNVNINDINIDEAAKNTEGFSHYGLENIVSKSYIKKDINGERKKFAPTTKSIIDAANKLFKMKNLDKQEVNPNSPGQNNINPEPYKILTIAINSILACLIVYNCANYLVNKYKKLFYKKKNRFIIF